MILAITYTEQFKIKLKAYKPLYNTVALHIQYQLIVPQSSFIDLLIYSLFWAFYATKRVYTTPLPFLRRNSPDEYVLKN